MIDKIHVEFEEIVRIHQTYVSNCVLARYVKDNLLDTIAQYKSFYANLVLTRLSPSLCHYDFFMKIFVKFKLPCNLNLFLIIASLHKGRHPLHAEWMGSPAKGERYTLFFKNVVYRKPRHSMHYNIAWTPSLTWFNFINLSMDK